MVAKITFPHKVYQTLKYNEQKVKKGQADCIGAVGYLREPGEMDFQQKLAGLKNRNLLNDRAITNTLHVSLNFTPSEKISNDTLFEIAREYMKRIGYSGQPFLVYRHRDTIHPHLHIVSTNIRRDGSRIPTHNLRYNQSAKAGEELELLFGLQKAKGSKNAGEPTEVLQSISRAVYGKVETKKSISEVVGTVLNSYAFSSLAEFNAALRQFNVLADRGKEGSRIYRFQGLLYRILTEKGEKKGVPIKASSLDSKPILKNLEKRFLTGEQEKQKHKELLKAKIDHCFSTSTSSLNQWTEALEKRKVFAELKKSSDGSLSNVTFVDNEYRCVFSGSDLGARYSALAIQGRLAVSHPAGKAEGSRQEAKQAVLIPPKEVKENKQTRDQVQLRAKELMQELLASKNSKEFVPNQLLLKKKNRKNRNMGL